MILPKGTYFIGDPCYSIRDNKRWSIFCDNMGEDFDELTEFEGTPIFVHGTMYGDGVYRGTDGFMYGVDSGLLGVIPTSLIDEKNSRLKELGTIVKFTEPFECTYDDGVFRFKKLSIDTSPDDEYEGHRN